MKLRHALGLVCAVFALFGDYALAGNELKLVLKAQSRVVGPELRLSEVAQIDCAQMPACDSVGEIVLGPTPLAGYEKRISKAYIERRLRQEIGRSVVPLIEGDDYVSVELVPQTITGETLTRFAEESLYSHLARNYVNIELNVTSRTRDVQIPRAHYYFRARMLGVEQAQRRMNVLVDVYVNEVKYTSVPVWFSVKTRQLVYVAKHDVQKESILSGELFERRLVEVSNLRGTPVMNLDEVEKKLLRGGLARGQIICSEDVREPPDVLAGELVDVIVTHNNLRMYTKAIARRSGNIGEIVELLNTSSNKTFKGVVESDGIVRSF